MRNRYAFAVFALRTRESWRGGLELAIRKWPKSSRLVDPVATQCAVFQSSKMFGQFGVFPKDGQPHLIL